MDSEKVIRALDRHAEIQKTIAELRNEDEAIVGFVNNELGIDVQSGTVQKFTVGDYTISCTVPQNTKVLIDEWNQLIKFKPELAKLEVFRTKYELDKKVFSGLTEEEKGLVEECLITTPGKTKVEIKKIGE